jgi:hypothetical protein
MNEKHFHATLTQIEERAKRLLGDVPLRVPSMEALAESCRRDLDSVIYSAQQLRDDTQFRHEAVQTERLQLLRNLFGQLDVLESTAVAALQRVNDEDRRMTRTIQALADECHFPLPAPVVSCTSQDYFNIDTRLRLVQMPLTDGRHLLHLPDLAHEMAHILLADLNNPKSKAFKQAMREVKARVIKHFDERGKNLALGRSPASLVSRIPVWWKSWMDAWVVEFFCDLFGVFSVGPAYGWAHLHLCMRQPTDSYHYPTFNTTSHPANAARTTVIVEGLRMAGFGTDADELAKAWRQLLHITGEKSDADFAECYPSNLVRSTVEFGFNGYRDIGCRVITTASMGTCQLLLNESWRQFRAEPQNYPAWESAAMVRFYTES